MSIVQQIAAEKGWTLFLDRDGVINVRLIDEYVRSWDEFVFIEGVLESIKVFNRFFPHVIVVTNQQGIGKGLMSIDDLRIIHNKMVSSVEDAGGKIDAVFFCPHLKSDGCTCRKPLTGNAEAAVRMFSDIDLSKSVMAGDSSSDMGFARNAGMKAVFIGETIPNGVSADQRFSSLAEFAQELLSCGS